MTGISELNQVRVVSAAPERIRVSVFGGRTQLDIALPLDVPVSGFVPELARLVRSRDVHDDDEAPAAKEERRTFWVLSRFDDGTVLAPNKTLRDAGVGDGDLLRLTSERALSPPTLYDDVVDAAARLNKTAYAGWDAGSARWMGFTGVHLAALTFGYFLVHPAFAADRAAIIGLAATVALTLVGAAAIAHRSYRLDDVAAALGWAAIPITAGIGWAALSVFDGYGVAAGCAAVLLLNAGYYRMIGTGLFGFLAASVPLGLGGLAVLARTLGLRADVVGVVMTVGAALGCLLVPRLTAKLGRFEPPMVDIDATREERVFDNPFAPGAQADRDPDSGTAMPTAEVVWSRVRSAAVARSALLSGLAASVVVGAAAVLHTAAASWAAAAFAAAHAAVLGLRSRAGRTGTERAAVAVPAMALIVITAVLAQNGPAPLPVVAVGVLLAIVVGAAAAGLTLSGAGLPRRFTTTLSYLEYLMVAALIPLALWVTGGYHHLGGWWR